MSAQVCNVTTGTVPLLISMPHNGEALAQEIKASMTAHGLSVPDTDWCIDRLYDFADELGVYTIRPNYNRIVIDLNRDPKGVNLYPGAQSTELCPTTCFDFSPVYLPGKEPDQQEIARRVALYWQPYHQQLDHTLNQIKNEYGVAVLLDAHSIRSQVSRFFDGSLPDFNFGTADASSCSAQLQAHLDNFSTERYSQVSNGRFKGGYITRAYGNPENDIHSVQLELSQCTYMDETNAIATYDDERASKVKVVLEQFVKHLLIFANEQTKSN